MEGILSKKNMVYWVNFPPKIKVLQAEVSRRAEAATSSYSAVGHFSQCG